MYDLVLRGGTVVDPGQGLEGDLDVAIADGKIAAVRAGISESEATRVVDVAGKLVTPGLVDFHAHAYWGGTGIGVEPDESCLKHGVTTVIDGGSSGSDNFAGFRRWIVGASRTRVYAFVHLASVGLAGVRKSGELVNRAYADPEGALEILRRHPDVALGLKLRASKDDIAGPCLPLLMMGRQVADEAQVPIMVHIGDSVETLAEILAWLRAGDIVTHCLTARPNGLLDDEGRLLPQVREARERGILFDSAHGRSHFDYETAAKLLDQGFPPDTISTDLTLLSTAGPVYDLPTVMTKFLMLGMPLAEVVHRTTLLPAQLLGRADQFGSMRPGLAADVAVLQWEEGELPLKDTSGETRIARRWLVPYLTIKDGEPVWPDPENR